MQKLLTIRMTDEDHALCKEAALHARMPLVTLARKVLLDYCNEEYLRPRNHESRADAVLELEAKRIEQLAQNAQDIEARAAKKKAEVQAALDKQQAIELAEAQERTQRARQYAEIEASFHMSHAAQKASAQASSPDISAMLEALFVDPDVSDVPDVSEGAPVIGGEYTQDDDEIDLFRQE